MPLRVAVQMDPLEKINISGDSTFALMLRAQERGHKLYHYLAEDLTYQDGRLYAGAHEVSVQPVAGDHFRLGEFAILDLGTRRRCRADAPGPAVRPRLHHGDASARADPGRDPGRQRPGRSPQRAGKGLGARLRAVHAADDADPVARRRPQVRGRAWRDRPQAAPRQCRQSGVQDRPRRRQPRAADGAVQRHLSRAARASGIPSRGRRGRQADRAGRRGSRRRDQPPAGARARSARTSPRAAQPRRASSPTPSARSALRSGRSSSAAGCCSSAST